MGVLLLLVPRSEALASPVCRNETTPKPTHWYINDYRARSSIGLSANSVMNIHLLDVFVALMFDIRLGNCQIPERQAQSVKYAFPIYRFPPSIPLKSETSAREQLQNKRKFTKPPNFYETFFISHQNRHRKNRQTCLMFTSRLPQGYLKV